MVKVNFLLVGLALSVVPAMAQEEDPEYDDFGPAAFLWPEDRVWDATVDNQAPCGSKAGPLNRTDFPLENGRIALIAQEESWQVQLGISYKNNPTSNEDFDIIISQSQFKEMDPGHACVPWPKAPSSVRAGDLATLQVQYISDFDTPQNQTFYACADITWVEVADFDIRVPCFNATEPDNEKGTGRSYHDSDDDDETDGGGKDGDSADESEDNGSDNSSGGLSKGAIAGIVLGIVGGVGLFAAVALLIYRRKQQRLRQLRQANSPRTVPWTTDRTSGKGSVSSSVEMPNMKP